MESFKTFAFINESAKSDKHEKDVADYIDAMEDMKAERPKVSAAYADVKIEKSGRSTGLKLR